MKILITRNVVLIAIFSILLMVFINSCQNMKYTEKYSTLIGKKAISLNKISDYSNGNLTAIVYYLPFYTLTRAPLGIEDVKKMYRIEITETSEIYDFLKSIENITYTIKDYDYLNLRCVVEFFIDDALTFFYSINTEKDIIIDSHMINNGNEFISFVSQYLHEEYLYDISEYHNFILSK